MQTLRALFLSSPRLILAMMLVALAAKLIVPAGYMLMPTEPGAMTLSVGVCNATGPAQLAISIPVERDHAPADKGATDGKPCAFAGLGQPVLAGADPVLLVLAIAFVLALGFAARPVLRLVAAPRLLPPAQAPPLLN